MDIFIPIFIIFTIFVLCSLCGFCCKKRNEGAIFSTPVVITSQTHQPVGSSAAYPIHTGGMQSGYPPQSAGPPVMPMPYSDNSAPYPPATGNTPYPVSAPYPTGGNAPYPTPYGQQQGMYPQSGVSPYPPQAAPYPMRQDSNPPAYNDVVANQSYQKQAPYNPNYTG